MFSLPWRYFLQVLEAHKEGCEIILQKDGSWSPYTQPKDEPHSKAATTALGNFLLTSPVESLKLRNVESGWVTIEDFTWGIAFWPNRGWLRLMCVASLKPQRMEGI